MLYFLGKVMFSIFFTIFCRWSIIGKENFPSRGPVVVVSNHVSNWDPVAVGVGMPRRVYFMAKEELFGNRVFSAVLRGLGAFPVRRGEADLAAMRWALRLLRQGKVVGIFPEGGRNTGEGVASFQKGAALMAARGHAPIVPVAVVGTKRIAGREGVFRHFEVRIGKPISLGPEVVMAGKKELACLSQKAQEAVAELVGRG